MPSLKRKRADSQESTPASSLGELSSLPVPLTTRPLPPRVDSPRSSSMSSAGSIRTRGRKRRWINEEDARDVEMEVEFTNGNIPQVEPHNENEEGGEDVSLATTINGTSSKRKGKQRADPYFVDDEEGEDFKVAGPSHHHHHHAGPSNQSGSGLQQTTPSLLSSYTCPVCFSTVTNACLTPCGHILCGACLFASVKSGIQRSMELAVASSQEGFARYVCPRFYDCTLL